MSADASFSLNLFDFQTKIKLLFVEQCVIFVLHLCSQFFKKNLLGPPPPPYLPIPIPKTFEKLPKIPKKNNKNVKQ